MTRHQNKSGLGIAFTYCCRILRRKKRMENAERESLRAISQTSFRDLIGMVPHHQLAWDIRRSVPPPVRRVLRRYLRLLFPHKSCDFSNSIL
jgi:hypothetical protein